MIFHQLNVFTAGLSQYNPSTSFLDALRTLNIILGICTCLMLAFVLARPRWKTWPSRAKLIWMAVFSFSLSVSYGSFEVQFLDTYFRVPMVTASLSWALIASLWPNEPGHNDSKRK